MTLCSPSHTVYPQTAETAGANALFKPRSVTDRHSTCGKDGFCYSPANTPLPLYNWSIFPQSPSPLFFYRTTATEKPPLKENHNDNFQKHYQRPSIPIHARSDNYSSTLLTLSHSPFRVSFHSVTLLSPPLTASTFPLRLQLTRQTTVSRGIILRAHDGPFSYVQIITLLSWDADAMYDFWRMLGAHATSRTQSVWPSSVCSSTYVADSALLSC